MRRDDAQKGTKVDKRKPKRGKRDATRFEKRREEEQETIIHCVFVL